MFQWEAVKDILVINGYQKVTSPGGLECWYKPGFKPSDSDLRQAEIEADFIDQYRDEVGFD